MYRSYSDGLYALERYQRVFSHIIVIIRKMRSFLNVLSSFLLLQFFNIIHLTAGAYLVRADPDKICTLFQFNKKKIHKFLSCLCFLFHNRPFPSSRIVATVIRI